MREGGEERKWAEDEREVDYDNLPSFFSSSVRVCIFTTTKNYVQRTKKHPGVPRIASPPSLPPSLPSYSAKQLCTFWATTRAFARSFGVKSLRLFPPKITNPSLLSKGCNTTA